MAKKLDYEYCKAAPMLEWLGNKWALVVLVKISENEPVRFNELYRNIPSVSEKVLSQVLRQLTTDGIIRRELFPDVPPRTEYSVTDFGRTILPHVEALINWGRDNFDTIMSNRKKSQDKTMTPSSLNTTDNSNNTTARMPQGTRTVAVSRTDDNNHQTDKKSTTTDHQQHHHQSHR